MLTWTVTGGGNGSQSRRYTEVTPEFPVTEWATDHLSQTYDNVETFMRVAQLEARESVMAASRVDTGLMRGMVESTLATPGERFVLEFGWWEGVPHYAPYQEFGTQYIEPMLAVHSTYLSIYTELLDVIIP